MKWKKKEGFVLDGEAEIALVIGGTPVYIWPIPDSVQNGDTVTFTIEVPVRVKVYDR